MVSLLKSLFAATVCFLPLAGSAFPLNAKKGLDNVEDQMAIEEALHKSLPRVKPALVCIDLGEGTGSGVIVSEDGLVMTAAHVSTGVGRELTVIMVDGTKLKGKSLGLMSEVDAALVQITEKLPDDAPFPTVEINRTGDTKLGDWIFSLGHSGGFDEKRGAVARLGRLVRVANSTIQTDGTLIGGDSGGPLFDMDGRLIGIHSRVGPQLPVNMHVPVAQFFEGWDRMLASEFIGEGPFAKKPVKGEGFLGVATKDVDGGLEVTKVGKKSPAEMGGLKEGDLLRELNGVELVTKDDLKGVLKELSAGDELKMEITRDGNDETIELRLGKR
ncbi:MAG: S1C family serine protease [Luteolibacter sp.]